MRGRSRTHLVILATGFLLGSLITAHAQELIFVPFVARAGTESLGVEVVNLRQSSAKDVLAFFGEVRNNTSEAIWLHEVTVHLLDGSGFAVDTISTTTDPFEIVPPGGKRPFRAFSDAPVSAWSSYRTSVDWEPTGYLTVLSQDLRLTVQGWAIDVTFENQHPVAVQDPLIIGTLYGPEGATIGYSEVSAGGAGSVLLLPGAQYRATVTFERGDSRSYDASVIPSGYDVVVVP